MKRKGKINLPENNCTFSDLVRYNHLKTCYFQTACTEEVPTTPLVSSINNERLKHTIIGYKKSIYALKMKTGVLFCRQEKR